MSPFGEQHEPMQGLHHNMAMGDVGGVGGHGMAEAVWNPRGGGMQLDGNNPKASPKSCMMSACSLSDGVRIGMYELLRNELNN